MKHENRILWSAVLLGMTIPASSSAADSLAAVLACRALVDPPERLACFDRETALLAGGLKAPPAAEKSPPVATVANGLPAVAGQAAPLPLSSTQQFGLANGVILQKEVAAGVRSAELRSIQARVSNLAVSEAGIVELTLDNGQVWRQLKAGQDLLLKSGDPVTIARGWLNSYSLQVPSGRECKVERVR